MGLTKSSTGIHALDSGLEIRKTNSDDKIAAVAGNPNVGKSTLFNNLTGMHQHTGNWPGKTVAAAQGRCTSQKHSYILVDIPGTYSLMARSAEEEAARSFLCFGQKDAVVVVCDATCLERNLNLVLQILEVCPRVLVCVNLLDEARRKGIFINLDILSQRLGVPVVGTVARKKKSLQALLDQLDRLVDTPAPENPFHVSYGAVLEEALAMVVPCLERAGGPVPARWAALKLLENDPGMIRELEEHMGSQIVQSPELLQALKKARFFLENHGLSPRQLQNRIGRGLVDGAHTIAREAVSQKPGTDADRDQRLDRILTSRLWGYPLMLLLTGVIFWLTIAGANVPSQMLSRILFDFQDVLTRVFHQLGAPSWLHGLIVLGGYRVLAWVVSVMLPPMAIFFPLFTLLEDSGYLPRIAYCLDRPFQRCRACGKQALTMAMGLGCNAAGVTGCRIIDSPRERMIAMLTNCFVPCNGKFPTLAALISMFFASSALGPLGGIQAAVILTGLILFGILMTFLVSWVLSRTILKGMPSSFTLELPPYRRPQIGKVLIRSVLDRTLFVLGRAAAVAAPAGMILWILANVRLQDGLSLLNGLAGLLDPPARLLGMDGVILMAFILGLPANEIVLPIIMMAYLSQGTLTQWESLAQLKELLAANGWTWSTAASTMLFSLVHWPCSTTLLTIRRESSSWKWTALAFLIPGGLGCLVCLVFSSIVRLLD